MWTNVAYEFESACVVSRENGNRDLKPKNKVHLLCSYGYAPDQTPALLPGENDNATVNTISYE
ncbi:hypothetical protein T4E_10482 [Trichinella pseudospiralis]|uniref:Uncharacterized protein n=1 Tax=Trichinella pseudospiralis TaxID=6337 RepID=A0A0V0XFL0_TRIPS|nr:hypothetical protein T4E_10482 [Trichinella pseudospiralis]